MKRSNQLIYASSPYLLQHAHNPVNWQEWGEAALKQARDEQKLLLVSIGYSACHWCHVMERESFENEAVASLMNAHFVCVKVDREERPDIDQLYMLAVQLMNGNGGWPLNVFCLPDQRPIYGGTYFDTSIWINLLTQLDKLWQNEPRKLIDYAAQLEQGLHQAERLDFNRNVKPFDHIELQEMVNTMKAEFDLAQGGYRRAPKFPLSNNWLFLLRYGVLTKNEEISEAVRLYADSMAAGGIYDQIGGGFARYSVDEHWHIPHFEKMLYDNAQLISFYSEMYQCFKQESYAQIIRETIAWLEREMMSAEGLFYSALDADSEGEEGKFYSWYWDEFQQLLGDDGVLAAKYFDVLKQGNWEENQSNVLRRLYADKLLSAEFGISEEELALKVARAKQLLRAFRDKRVHPSLDDKCLTSWNAILIRGLVDAGQALDEPRYIEMAERIARFLLQNMLNDEGILYRNYKKGKVSVPGFLDDYAFFIDALISLYQANFNEAWLNEAHTLTEYVLANFTDEDSPMFFYTAQHAERLVARKHEVMDNVMPASNSVMAQNLQVLGLFLDSDLFAERSIAMLSAVLPHIKKYGSAYSNWSIQWMNEVFGLNQIALVGADYQLIRTLFNLHYIPNKLFLGGIKSSLPLLREKVGITGTQLFLCSRKTCQLPVTSVEEILKQIRHD